MGDQNPPTDYVLVHWKDSNIINLIKKDIKDLVYEDI